MDALRKCPYSGEYFKPRRSNQKYASKYNRIAFHNKHYRQQRLPLERLNQKLYNNYFIISDLIGDSKEIELNNDFLKGKGYDFKYITHIHHHGNKTYFGLYDFWFIKFDDTTTKFIKNETN